MKPTNYSEKEKLNIINEAKLSRWPTKNY